MPGNACIHRDYSLTSLYTSSRLWTVKGIPRRALLISSTATSAKTMDSFSSVVATTFALSATCFQRLRATEGTVDEHWVDDGAVAPGVVVGRHVSSRRARRDVDLVVDRSARKASGASYEGASAADLARCKSSQCSGPVVKLNAPGYIIAMQPSKTGQRRGGGRAMEDSPFRAAIMAISGKRMS